MFDEKLQNTVLLKIYTLFSKDIFTIQQNVNKSIMNINNLEGIVIPYSINFTYHIKDSMLYKELNLFLLYETIKLFFFRSSISLMCAFILIGIFVLLLFKIIQSYFYNELLQAANYRKLLLGYGNIYGFSNQSIIKYLLNGIFNPIITKLHPKDYIALNTFLHNIVLKNHKYDLIILLCYNIIMNKGILPMTCNRALFCYLLYLYWLRFSNFVYYNNTMINKIIFTVYYRAYSIKYLELPSEWQNIIYAYIKDGLF